MKNNCRIFLLGFLCVSASACAEYHEPIDPVGSTVQNYYSTPPTTTFKRCNIYSRTMYVNGRVYVVQSLRCVDDRGNVVFIN